MYKDKYSTAKHKPEVCNGLIHFTNYTRVSTNDSTDFKVAHTSFIDEKKTPKRLPIPIVSEENTPKENDNETTRNSLDIVPMRRLSNIV